MPIILVCTVRKGAEEGFVSITYRELEEKLGMNPATVCEVKTKLESAGVLETERGVGNRDRSGPRPTKWKLNPDRLVALVGRKVAVFGVGEKEISVVERDGKYLVMRNGKREGEFGSEEEAVSVFYELCLKELKDEGKRG